MPNSIPTDQNEPKFFRLLQARQELWRCAQNWQKVQLCLVVVLPIVGAIGAVNLPEHRLTISLIAVAMALLDATFVDRHYRAAIKRAAKASEHFDTSLFRLPWNRLAAGEPLQAEALRAATRRWKARNADAKLYDWYPARIGDAPVELGRVLCQRTNVSYDSALRRTYSRWLFGSLVAIALILFAYGVLRTATINDLLLGFLLPLAPFVIFALREGFRQKDAAEANDIIREEAEGNVTAVIERRCTPEECFQRSRELQAAIFSRRAANPLVFPGLYWLLRGKLEIDMHDGADEWLEKAGL